MIETLAAPQKRIWTEADLMALPDNGFIHESKFSNAFPHTPGAGLRFLTRGVKSNFAPRLVWRSHQFPNCIKHRFELGIVLFLERIESVSQLRMQGEPFTQLDESPNYVQAYSNRFGTIQNIRGHEGTVFRKNTREAPTPTVART
jgi:hypothetical protein